MKIIGISGKKYAGKDTLYGEILKIDPKAIRIAFADALKDEVYEAILKPEGIERAALDDERKKFFRLILQGWGGEFRRQFNTDTYWLDKTKEKIEALKLVKFEGLVVITDVRYKNEATWIKDQGGLMVRVNRPRSGWKGWIKDTLKIIPDKHKSECDLDKYKFDYVVNNKGSLLDLNWKAHIVMGKIKK